MGKSEDLTSELAVDPLGIDYAGMNDETATNSLNDDNSGRTLPKTVLTAGELYEVFDPTELDLKSEPERQAIDRMLSLGHQGDLINFASGSNALAVMNNLFPSGTTNTGDALIAALIASVSRATEIGLPFIKVGYVETARR